LTMLPSLVDNGECDISLTTYYRCVSMRVERGYVVLKCPECKSAKITKLGFTWRSRKKVQRWRCLNCGRTFTEERQ